MLISTLIAGAAAEISVNTLTDTTRGTALFISGEANLDVGMTLNVVVRSATFSVVGNYPESFNGTTIVFQHSNGKRLWHILVKTRDMFVDEYDIIITDPQTGVETWTRTSICEPVREFGTTRDTYWINIEKIPDQMLGSIYTIHGETNLPIGSKLLFEHVKYHDVYDGTRVYTTYHTMNHGTDQFQK